MMIKLTTKLQLMVHPGTLQVVTLVSHSPGNLHKSGGCNLEIPVASPPFVQVASPPFVQAVQPN